MIHTNASRRTLIIMAAAALAGCLDAEVPDEAVDEGDPDLSTTSSEVRGPGVHRAYKPSTGEHFYTQDWVEAAGNGYNLEFLNYFRLETTQLGGWIPLYRCWWTTAGMHFISTGANCESWEAWNEGTLGFIATTQVLGTQPLYRLYHPSYYDHLYTTNLSEAWSAYYAGYHYERIEGYVYP